jgi:myo-inositol-1-phosphate synthase
MDDLIPFVVDGPVKYYKILNHKEKQQLFQKRIIQIHEIRCQIVSFHDQEKRVIGYDINDE